MCDMIIYIIILYISRLLFRNHEILLYSAFFFKKFHFVTGASALTCKAQLKGIWDVTVVAPNSRLIKHVS